MSLPHTTILTLSFLDDVAAEIYKRQPHHVTQLAGSLSCSARSRGSGGNLRGTTDNTGPNHLAHSRQRIESTAIAAIGYSKRRHILEIEFVNGAIYRYLDVPPAVHRDLMSAESKARFYDSNIRRHYRSIPIRPRQNKQLPAKPHE